MSIGKTAILGAGGWGTALAVLLAERENEIVVWGHDAGRVEQMQSTRQNEVYLPGTVIPDKVVFTDRMVDCADADLVLFVTPSKAVREVARQFSGLLSNRHAILLSCTKGIEHGSGLRMTEILAEFFPHNQIAALSGPNLAVEVARGLPTATALGCSEPGCADRLQRHLGTARFRVYTSREVSAIELGGALKNVFAIPAGVSDGFGFGDNSKASLVTRSMSELLRLGVAMGGHRETFQGLSGAGDLIATCFSRHSRNRRVGEQLGKGESLESITRGMQMVAEGVPTTLGAYECARRLGVETPIVDQVYAVLYEGKSPAKAMQELLGRDQKQECG